MCAFKNAGLLTSVSSWDAIRLAATYRSTRSGRVRARRGPHMSMVTEPGSGQRIMVWGWGTRSRFLRLGAPSGENEV